jgi:ribosomal protein S18 acetylase RimI-like enzyme
MIIRAYHPGDLAALETIIVEAFEGVSIDEGIEKAFGVVNGRDWRWRKARHLHDDVARDPAGVFVAELDGKVVGFITTWLDRDAGFGMIPNLAISRDHRNQGIGRRLIEHALDHFRNSGMTHARIETLVQNARGEHLYESCGFREVSRQIHFAMEL